VIREVNDAKLMGREARRFPPAKWTRCAPAGAASLPDRNADESEPGTFGTGPDGRRSFGLVEAMTIAAYATGCEEGFIYLRGEYPLAYERLMNALDTARARGSSEKTFWVTGSTSTSRSAKAGARTSAGKRRRSSTRSKDSRRAAEQASVPGAVRCVPQTHGHQQR
jgi:NADH:ubiquinone oxidoreductase subunit F (NADH-binding)